MIRRNDIPTLEHAMRLDVAQLLAGGSLTMDRGKVKTTPSAAGILLTWCPPGGSPSAQSVRLIRHRLAYGGARVLVLCACGARVRSVYLNQVRSAWGCRWCLGLRYRSQRVRYPSRG